VSAILLFIDARWHRLAIDFVKIIAKFAVSARAMKKRRGGSLSFTFFY
jgi:hypothetical protein